MVRGRLSSRFHRGYGVLHATLNDPVLDSVSRQAGDVVDVKLFHHIVPVLLDGFDTNSHPACRFLVCIALGDELEYLGFPGTENGCLHFCLRTVRNAGLVPVMNETSEYPRAEAGLTTVHLADRLR